MKKFVVVLLLLLLAGYFYWPYHTVGRLEDALRLADRETIEKLVDFPAVRQSLKAQMAASRASLSITHREVPANSLQHQMLKSAGLLTQFMTDSAIDSMVTPERLTEGLKLSRTLRKDDTAFELPHPSWTGLNSCTVTFPDKTLLKLRLAGTDGWRVVGMETNGGLLAGGMPIPAAP